LELPRYGCGLMAGPSFTDSAGVPRPAVGVFNVGVDDADTVGTPDATGTPGLTTGSATGAGTSALDGGEYKWSVGAGTFSGASLQLQSSPDGGTTYYNVDGAVLTAAGEWQISVGAGEKLKVVVTGGPPSGIKSYLRKVQRQKARAVKTTFVGGKGLWT